MYLINYLYLFSLLPKGDYFLLSFRLSLVKISPNWLLIRTLKINLNRKNIQHSTETEDNYIIVLIPYK